MKPPGTEKGFTLIELMTVIGIMGVLFLVTVPTMTYFLPGYRLNTTARELQTNFQLARATAARRNVRCVAAFFLQGQHPANRVDGYIMFLDYNGNWQQDDLVNNTTGMAVPDGKIDPWEETVLVYQEMPPGTMIKSATFTNNGNAGNNQLDVDGDGVVDAGYLSSPVTLIGFDHHGLAARSVGGVFVFGDVVLKNTENKYRKISITPAGQVNMQKSSDGMTWQ